MKSRRHILTPYAINGHSVRYSVRLRYWVVDELHYFKTKREAFAFCVATKARQEPVR